MACEQEDVIVSSPPFSSAAKFLEATRKFCIAGLFLPISRNVAKVSAAADVRKRFVSGAFRCPSVYRTFHLTVSSPRGPHS
ncbi:hypothetical protein HPB52_011654 [Rhipicephalus sanguineus]|uniref:Uncharacterized protein n=1 Tax=Rhipicephalus sanguineus TaxID=34632 RepID=A0A9D4YP82_RHISA|nr:hypothetical protein HPB52_011654 [Rhipicephalus sanguineus]